MVGQSLGLENLLLQNMSKTLLAIISSPQDNELVARHWPFMRLTGWDILGCGTQGRGCVWPDEIQRIDTGVIGKKQNAAGSVIHGLIGVELDIWAWFLERHEYTDVAVVEADNLFVRKPPDHPCNGLYLVTCLPNYSKEFQTPVYFSSPRWADRQTAQQLHAYGRKMFKNKDTEHDVSDRFPALICHRHKIPWINQPAWSPSAFAWQAKDWQAAWVRDARAAIKIGCYCLHSVKFSWQLEALRDLLPIQPAVYWKDITPCPA